MVNYFSGKFIFEDLITPALKCLPAQTSGEKAIFKSNFVNQAYLHLTRKKKKKKKKKRLRNPSHLPQGSSAQHPTKSKFHLL